MKQIKINEEFKAIIPPLSKAEYDELEQSILTEGCRDPLLVWNGTIVDGHNRYEICIKYDIPYMTKEISFECDDDAKIWIIANQLARRNLTDFSRIELALKRKDILLEQGKKKQKQTLGGYKHNQSVLSNLDKTEESHNTQKIIADELNVGSGTIARVEQIIAKAPEEVIDQLRRGDEKMSINKAYMQIRHADIKEPPPIPDGKFRVIYADPPWFYGQQVENYGPAERHYPTMKTDEICEKFGSEIKKITADNAVLFLWTTSPKLKDAFDVMEAWGFRYSGAQFIWDKVKHNFGHYNSVRHEHLLICVKGSCLPDTKKLYDSVQEIERSDEHSQKPERFREIIDELYTYGDKLELFGREEHEGWVVWGNEVQPCL